MDTDPAWLETDFYAALGVDADVSSAELTKAYRRLARELHPDTNSDPGAVDRFKSASAAYDVLRDPDKRAAYDQARRRPSASGTRRRPGGGYTIRVDNRDGLRDVRTRDRRNRSVFDDVFGRAGNNLTLTVPVTYAEAALGADVTIPTIDGGPVTVRIPPGTPTGRVLRIRGRGVPTDAGRGDLLVTVHVDVPSELDDRQRELIRQLAEHDTTDLRDHLER